VRRCVVLATRPHRQEISHQRQAGRVSRKASCYIRRNCCVATCIWCAQDNNSTIRLPPRRGRFSLYGRPSLDCQKGTLRQSPRWDCTRLLTLTEFPQNPPCQLPRNACNYALIGCADHAPAVPIGYGEDVADCGESAATVATVFARRLPSLLLTQRRPAYRVSMVHPFKCAPLDGRGA
jgi:hypothetical protein